MTGLVKDPMTASIFLAVFLGLALSRAVCWAFVQTIWLPLMRRRGAPRGGGPIELPGQDEVSSAEQWLHRAALAVPVIDDSHYFQATVRLAVTALEYRRSFGAALDQRFVDTDLDRRFADANMDSVGAPETLGGQLDGSLDQLTCHALYAYAAVLHDAEAARRNRLSEAVMEGIDAMCQRRPLFRGHRAVLEEYVSGAWRPSQDDPEGVVVTAVRVLLVEEGPLRSAQGDPEAAIVTAVRALLAKVDRIQGPGGKEG